MCCCSRAQSIVRSSAPFEELELSFDGSRINVGGLALDDAPLVDVRSRKLAADVSIAVDSEMDTVMACEIGSRNNPINQSASKLID